jgi:hypothetical protein
MAEKKEDELQWESKTARMRLEMRSSPSLLKAVDEWRRRQEDIPTRSEAFRRLVEIGLKAQRRKW